jgi:cytidylate kinase
MDNSGVTDSRTRTPYTASSDSRSADSPGGATDSTVRPLLIAIDGPSGAGKGTIARALAARLGYRHVDTGAMYRALAWKALHDGIDLTDEDALASLAGRAAFEVSEGRVQIDGHDVARAIRTPEIDRAATSVARQPRIREALVARQRAMGAGGGVVMEGRDIGTVVFPGADVKIFLDASAEERARRRATDSSHASGTGAIQEVAVALAERDRSDRGRAASPLVQADDAVVIDTTHLSIDEALDRALLVVDQLRSL